MRRYLWRFALVLGLSAAVLPFTAATPASATPTAPTYTCATTTDPKICAAAQLIEGTFIALKIADITGVSFGSWMTTIGFDDSTFGVLGSGGVLDPEDVGLCNPGTCLTTQEQEAVKQFLKYAGQKAKEAEKYATICSANGWLPDCSDTLPQPIAGQSGYNAFPTTGLLYTGPANGTFTKAPYLNGAGAMFTIPVPAATGTGNLTSTALRWTQGSGNWSGYIQMEWQRTGGIGSGPWVQYRFRMCGGWGSSILCTNWTGSSNINSTAKNVVAGWRQYCNPGDGINYRDQCVDLWGSNGTLYPGGGFQWIAIDYYGTGTFDAAGSQGGGVGATVQTYSSISQANMGTKALLFDEDLTSPYDAYTPPAPVRPGVLEPTPTTEASPTTSTTAVNVPVTTPPTGTDAEKEQTLLQRIVNGVASGFSWLGGLFGQWIKWLGDIFGYWIRWLWERAGALLRVIRDAINTMADLMVWVLTEIRDALAYMGDMALDSLRALWDVLEALATLPELIGDAILNGLQSLLELLFVPSSMPEFNECGDTFPCNWVEEANGMLSQIQDGISGSTGCTTPSIGWSQFEASFPPPPGCSGGNAGAAGANDDVAGDLFGWRTTIRTILALALWLGFIRKLLGLAPWSREGDMPISEGAVL